MSQTQSRIAQLSAEIAQHTQRIDEFLADKGLPYPSFHADAPVDLGLPPEVERSRTVVLQATQELNDLLQGPRDLLFNHQHNQLVYLKLIDQFDIAKKVPVDGEITFSDLSKELSINEGALVRVLRLAIANRIFQEPRPGVIAHSAASRKIADDISASSWVGACVNEMWPAAEKFVDALVKWPEASELNQTGFSLANATDKSFYAVLAQEPGRARRFGNAMSSFSTGEGYSLNHLTNGYAWDKLPSGGTVVDLGGSHGDAAFSLARKYPNLHFIVQDLPEVNANSKEIPDLDVKFMAHNFFEDQPVKNADIYLFRWTLHNWPDKYCLQIFERLIPALKAGARVLIMDIVLPPPGVLPNNMERKIRAMDVTMLEISNAKERDLNDWKTRFAQVDPRFSFVSLQQPSGSRLAIIEMSWN